MGLRWDTVQRGPPAPGARLRVLVAEGPRGGHPAGRRRRAQLRQEARDALAQQDDGPGQRGRRGGGGLGGGQQRARGAVGGGVVGAGPQRGLSDLYGGGKAGVRCIGIGTMGAHRGSSARRSASGRG